MYWIVLLINYVLASSNPELWPKDLVEEADKVLGIINNHRIIANNGWIKEPLIFETDNETGLFTGNLGIYRIDFDYELADRLSHYNKTIDELVLWRPSFEVYIARGYIPVFKLSKKQGLANVLKVGASCFNIDYCSKSEFTNYKTCVKKDLKYHDFPIKEEYITGKCRNSWKYYPRLMVPFIRRITYVDSGEFRYFFAQATKKYNEGFDYFLKI